MNNTPANINQLTTMTTVEISEYTGKNHQHVRRDAKAMLMENYGPEGVSKYGHTYKDSLGRDQACYLLPRNEVLCLISGYSSPLRMKIIRRLEELESGAASVVIQRIPSIAVEDLGAFEKMAEFFGVVGNQAKLSANTAVKKLHGFDCMETLGVTNLISENQIQYFTPTVIGKPHGLTAAKTNKALEAAGFQTCLRDHKNRIIWCVTTEGKRHCTLLDTNKTHSDGTPIMQIKWDMSALDGVV